MRKALLCVGTVVGVALLVFSQVAAAGSTSRRYVVVFERGASAHDAAKAIHAAGGKILKVNHDIGVATVSSTNSRFAVKAAARRRSTGPPRSGRSAATRACGARPAGRAVESERRHPRRSWPTRGTSRRPSTATSCRACSGT